MSFDKDDDISKENREALYNAQNEDVHGNGIKFLGEYDFVPIPQVKQKEIVEAINEINQIASYTVRNLKLQQNINDLQDKIFNRVMWPTNNVNQCVRDARNVKEVNVCADAYINLLRTQTKREVIEILKDY